MAEEEFSVPAQGKGDVAHALVKAVVSSVPVVGGAAAEIFALVIAPPLQKRQERWMNDVAEGLREIKNRTPEFSIEALRDNEPFISAVLNASRAAIRDHQDEKREALRNAVLNVAIGSGLDEDVEAIYIHLIDRYTPWHLRILRLFQNPADLGAARGLRAEKYYAGSRAQLLEEYYPELRGQRQFYDLLVSELRADGMLAVQDLQGMITGQGMFQKVTTEWGDRFIAFISSPI